MYMFIDTCSVFVALAETRLSVLNFCSIFRSFDDNIRLYDHSLHPKCVENTEVISDSAVEKQEDCLEKVEENSYENPYTISLRDKK